MNRSRLRTLLAYPFRKYGTCMVAVTNRCNGHCGFCSIPHQRASSTLPPEALEQAITQLHQLGVRYVQFTGGEPLLYPHLARVITHASNVGMLATLVTNASLLDAEKAAALSAAGVLGVSISVDHYDAAIFERNRGIPGLADLVAQAVRHMRKHHMPVQASTTISKLLKEPAGDYERLVEHNRELGFDGTYFCYPMARTNSNYALGGVISEFRDSELAAIIAHIKDLKKQGYPVDNSHETLDAALAFLQRKPSKYPCVAGYKVFYLDWNLELYDCMTRGNHIGSILEMDTRHTRLPRQECEQCILSCDREPSIYQHGARSALPFLRLLGDTFRRGVTF